MAYVITQACCNDASCVSACPVNCIHPTPDEPGFATAEMLHIEPQVCIDCGACVDACPVNAIFPEDQLAPALERYREINADYYTQHPMQPGWLPLKPESPPVRGLGTLRVAIVGAGPAACYAAEQLLARSDVEVEMFERLPTPWGLVRAGVAPDHPGTKAVTEMFDWSFRRESFRFHLNVEVGRHVSHADLLAHHHAVLYAVGASADRTLGIKGEDLPGSYAATEFVAWYNGHPDHADRVFDLSGERAVIVGNGNVALDVARILTMDPDDLARTDIADHALDALRASNVREVVLLGRRGPAQAAYTTPEFLALGNLPGVDVVIDPAEVELDARSEALLSSGRAESAVSMKVRLAQEFSERVPKSGNKRIVFRYLTSPTQVHGDDRVTALSVVANELVEDPADPGGALVARPTDRIERIDAGLVLRSIGYRGRPVPGVPFDEGRGVIPNDGGRVVTSAGEPLAGVYVAGWIKRGPSGVIGTNKTCATETVARIVEDFESGRLAEPLGGRKELGKLLARRRPERLSRRDWETIDRTERGRGQAAGRPRVKMTDTAEMVAVGRKRRGLFGG